MEKRNPDRGSLIAEARLLRVRWHTGEYVSVGLAVALANRLADAIEAALPEADSAERREAA